MRQVVPHKIQRGISGKLRSNIRGEGEAAGTNRSPREIQDRATMARAVAARGKNILTGAAGIDESYSLKDFSS